MDMFRNPLVNAETLTADNVLDYFCDSNNPFYERGCDNETLRMQNRSIAHLDQMTGMQYILDSSNPPLFVIRKHKRNGSGINDVAPTHYYYVLQGTVRQCPTLYDVVQTRLTNAADAINKAMHETLSMLKFSAVDGYKWEFKNRPAKRCGDEDEPVNDLLDASANVHCSHNRISENQSARTERWTCFQQTVTNRLIRLLVDKYPPQMKLEFPRFNSLCNIRDEREEKKEIQDRDFNKDIEEDQNKETNIHENKKINFSQQNVPLKRDWEAGADTLNSKSATTADTPLSAAINVLSQRLSTGDGNTVTALANAFASTTATTAYIETASGATTSITRNISDAFITQQSLSSVLSQQAMASDASIANAKTPPAFATTSAICGAAAGSVVENTVIEETVDNQQQLQYPSTISVASSVDSDDLRKLSKVKRIKK